jgi:hypothetical protein
MFRLNLCGAKFRPWMKGLRSLLHIAVLARVSLVVGGGVRRDGSVTMILLLAEVSGGEGNTNFPIELPVE